MTGSQTLVNSLWDSFLPLLGSLSLIYVSESVRHADQFMERCINEELRLSNTYQYFLRASLTGELVYIILSSICKESERSNSAHNLTLDQPLSLPKEIKYFPDRAYEETKETHIDFVEIEENILEKSDS